MPGLGQVYNGQFAKAIFFFVAFSGSIYLAVTETRCRSRSSSPSSCSRT